MQIRGKSHGPAPGLGGKSEAIAAAERAWVFFSDYDEFLLLSFFPATTPRDNDEFLLASLLSNYYDDTRHKEPSPQQHTRVAGG